MAQPALKAPVGDKRPDGDSRAPVKNLPDDVKLVRDMLKANGIDTGGSTKCDPALIKAIWRYQAKILSKKSRDGIVDPKGTSATKMMPAYKKWLKDNPPETANSAKAPKIDPKQKYYTIDTPKGKQIISEKEWKKQKAALQAEMKRIHRGLAIRLGMLTGRHDLQKKINADYPVVTFFCSSWFSSKGTEPTSDRTDAEKSLKAVEKSVKNADFAKFKDDVVYAELCINVYSELLEAWLRQLIGSGETWVKGLTITKDVSFTVFAAAATTVIAPAGAVATIATASGVGGGTAFLSSGAKEVGRAVAGEKMTLGGSLTNIRDGIIKGLFTGAAAGGFGVWAGRFLAPALTSKLLSSPVATKAVSKMVFGGVKSPVAKAILGRAHQAMQTTLLTQAAKATGQDIAKGTVLLTTKEMQKIAATTISKFLVRVGVGTYTKAAKAAFLSNEGGSAVKNAVKKKAVSMKGNVDNASIAAAVSEDLMKQDVVYATYEGVMKDQESAIQAEVEMALKNAMIAKLKAQK